MGKRANGEGSIFQRGNGRWVASLKDSAGRRRDYYGQTQREALTKLTIARKSVQDGLPLPAERLTVKAFLEQWLEAKQPSLRLESFRRYSDLCRIHLIPELGRRVLAKLTPADVQAAYAHCRDKGLSGTTLQLMHGVLHKALDDALRWNQVVRNVADLVDPPRRSTPQMRALSAEEASRLLVAAQCEPLEALYTLALTTGLRLGELQALCWHNVDLDVHRLSVTATLQQMTDGKPVFGEPKTARSRREVCLSDMAVDSLRRHRLSQLEQRLAAGSGWADYDLVFTNSLGKPLDGNNLRERSFKRLLAKAGLRPMRFHDLRHSAATLLMAEGVPIKVASEMLGHADITTTLRTYSHVLPGMQEQAATAMDRLFGTGS